MNKAITIFGIIIIIDLLVKKYNKPRIYIFNKLPKNYNALVIPPFFIAIEKENKNNKTLIKHEKIHWKQYQKLGTIGYYLSYFYQLGKYGYDKMPMEIEPRKLTGETEYCQINYTKCVREGIAKTVKDKNFRTYS